MAQQLPCQSEDGNLAIFIGTNLETGDSQTLCPLCMVQFFGTIIEGMTGLPVNALLESGPVDGDELVEITDDDEVEVAATGGDAPGEVQHDAASDPEHSPADAK